MNKDLWPAGAGLHLAMSLVQTRLHDKKSRQIRRQIVLRYGVCRAKEMVSKEWGRCLEAPYTKVCMVFYFSVRKVREGLVQGLRRFPEVRILAVLSGKDKEFNMIYALNEFY